jgi:glycosyltransferase involved in cell wall biosynthesis
VRICLLSSQARAAWSGVGTYCRVLANELAQLGQEVSVMAPGGGVIPGVRVVNLGPPLRGSSHAVWLAASVRYARALRGSSAFDVIHFADGREGLFCRGGGALRVGTVHDYYFAHGWREGLSIRRYYADWPSRYLYQRGVNVLERAALRKLDLVLFNSEAVKTKVSAAYGLGSAKLHVAYLAVPRRSVPQRRGGQRKPLLLFVGGNFQRKGVGVILRALALLGRDRNGIELRVVGGDHSALRMTRLAAELGIERQVSFLGWLPWENVMREMQDAAVLVMPSWEEGFGLVFLEAMQIGLPVIGGDVGGTRELISDGMDGFLVPPGNHRVLADRIARLLDDEALRRSLAEHGLATARRFTPRALASSTLKAYREARLRSRSVRRCHHSTYQASRHYISPRERLADDAVRRGATDQQARPAGGRNHDP